MVVETPAHESLLLLVLFVTEAVELEVVPEVVERGHISLSYSIIPTAVGKEVEYP